MYLKKIATIWLLVALILVACSKEQVLSEASFETLGTFSIGLETSQISATSLAIVNANTGSTLSTFPNLGNQVISLDEGAYLFCAPTPFALPRSPCKAFAVTATGLVDYDAALEGMVEGAGTTTLRVNGFTVTLDTTALSASSIKLSRVDTVTGATVGVTGTLSNTGTRALGLLPDDYIFCAPENFSLPLDPCLVFTVDSSGLINYDPSLEGVFNGQGTDTLVVNGFPINVDTTNLSEATYNLRRIDIPTGNSVNLTFSLSNTGTRSFGLLADRYQFCAPSGTNCLTFIVTNNGLIDYDSSLEGFFRGKGTTTLIVSDNLAPSITAISVPSEPVAIAEQPLSISASFTDPPNESETPYSCTIDYNDGTAPQTGTISGSTCTGTHSYAEPGVYQISVEVTDSLGATGSATATDLIVVYDPSGGFVTGGGWIQSEAGWCQLTSLCAAVSGKANFGFVSKYQKGASVPTGNTQFTFSAGEFNFHSDTYEWLVVNQGGTNAQFKGSGTINNQAEPYTFMIWATDDNPDTFRIKIWFEDSSTEVTVYDNGFDQVIGGGNIKVHKQQKQKVVGFRPTTLIQGGSARRVSQILRDK